MEWIKNLSWYWWMIGAMVIYCLFIFWMNIKVDKKPSDNIYPLH